MTGPALSACAALVQAGDPDRFLSAMTAPEPGRERLMALYAFNLELARVAPMVSEPMIGEIRLQWWQEVVEQIFAGGPVRSHEVATPFAAAVREAGLPQPLLEAMIAARRGDLYSEPHADRAAVLAYLDDTAGGLMLLSAQALAGPVPGAAERALAALGRAQGIANLLVALPALIAAARPTIAAAVGTGSEMAAGRMPEPLRAEIRALAEAGLESHRSARAMARDMPARARPAARAAWRARRLLERAARRPETVLEGFGESEFRRRFSLLRRALSGGW